MNLLATLFIHPQHIADNGLWIVVPLSIAVAAAYKAIRTESIRQLPREIFMLTLYILGGVVALMIAGWVIVSLK
jgi:hypothetical protein